jgi:hypothetical protein
MMMQADLIARLRGDAALTALLGVKGSRSAIDWVARPNAGSLPAVTLTEVTSLPIYTAESQADSTSAIVQLDVWSESVLDGVNAMDRIVSVLSAEATQGTTEFCRAFLNGGPRNMDVADLPGGARVHHRSADFQFYHRPI